MPCFCVNAFSCFVFVQAVTETLFGSLAGDDSHKAADSQSGSEEQEQKRLLKNKEEMHGSKRRTTLGKFMFEESSKRPDMEVLPRVDIFQYHQKQHI